MRVRFARSEAASVRVCVPRPTCPVALQDLNPEGYNVLSKAADLFLLELTRAAMEEAENENAPTVQVRTGTRQRVRNSSVHLNV
jgi:hypothetical protein